MTILVLNCGSSSVKYQVINGSSRQWLVRGNISQIGEENSEIWQQKNNGGHVKFNKPIKDHEHAIQQILEGLLSKATGVIKDISEIFAVGHRVVHGGEYFSQPTLITDEVLKRIEECSQLAPLHNPPQIKGIQACRKLLPGIPEVAVFDTAFHQTMPKTSYLYGLPFKYYEKYKIRRYGFHGTSHYYVANRAAKLEAKANKDLKIITCHLGNGCSMAAVKGGKCLDTSMGFTPLEGLLMGTRSGDIDCSAVLFLMRNEKLSSDQMDAILNKESGLKGLSENSNNMEKILEGTSKGDEKSQVALDIFCYRIKKYIGAYAAAMGGLDVLVFTAGIGENSSSVRTKSCEGLDFLGIELDPIENAHAKAEEKLISKKDARVKVWVIPTNEELVIAEETLSVVYSGR
ncbi:MAG TPA: acetate kinase [bacterium]